MPTYIDFCFYRTNDNNFMVGIVGIYLDSHLDVPKL